MPIRFACEQCGQKLSARTRQVGHVAKCPKCKSDVTVPASSTRSSSGSRPPDSESPGEEEDQDDLYSQFAVYDDDAEWIYEDETESSQQAPVAVNIDRVSIPRNILYFQGILLAVVAIVAFVFGVLVGGGSSPRETVQVEARPCTVAGHVHYLTRNGAEIPDEGTVVIVVPKNQQPSSEQRGPVEGLRPSDPLPHENHPALRAIRMLGGAYTRVDANGAYDLRLPAAGEYFVLVLSGNRYREANEDPVRADLAEIGGYFLPATELLGNKRYEWKSVQVRADQTLDNVVF
jgi:DNA-directed RNA polymerase subunit M/transcription elongation factor TFIIS